MVSEIYLIIGNVFSLLSSVFTLVSVAMTNKKTLIKMQTLSIVFYILTSFFLQAYAAMVSIFIALIRNILSERDLLTKKITLILCLLLVVSGLYVNNLGVMGLLPICAIVIYTILVYATKNEQQMRYAVIFNMIMWFIQNIYISAYPSAVSNIVVCLWTAFQIIKNRKKFLKSNASNNQLDRL